MNSLYSCIVNDHDLRVVALAAVICVLGVYATFSLATFAYFTKQKTERRVWAAACVFSSATSTWATHFVAMLAFHPAAPQAFDPGLTLASFLAALVVMGAGIACAVYASTRVQRAAGGATIGLGVSAMHYLGMAGYEVPGEVIWNGGAVAASVGLSMAFGCIGALAAFSPDRRLRHVAPPAMVLSVCSLHFVGMSAMTLVYDPAKVLAADAVDRTVLVALVSAAALLILAAVGAGAALKGVSTRRRREERDRLGALADVALEGLLICDGDRIVSANHSVAVLCARPAEALIGLSLGELIEGLRAEAISDAAEDEALLTCVEPPVPVRILRRGIEVAARPHHVVAVRDQRERLRVEAEMRDLAYSDALTGLPNRARFAADLEAQVTATFADPARAAAAGFAVMMVDLDRFKFVNDTLGHQAGDLVLQHVAGRLRAAVEGADVLARLGGDEFAVLQRHGGDIAQTHAVAARIVDLLGRPYLIEGQVVHIGASVGVALAPSDGETATELMRNADLAAYNAKNSGRGVFRLFEAKLDEKMQRRRALERDLRRAVARHEFELHYQPLVDAKSGRMTGAEALIRWNDPDRGLISPAEFIPLAEETGLIANIGAWALRTACTEALTWPAHLCVAVNLSPVQFRDPRLVDMIRGVLASTGLAPQRLELEITEGVLIADEVRTLETLQQLRRHGVRISMDDFGTGYSSLSYLRKFPFDKIKVDQSFISQTPHDREAAAIVRAILTMGACLGLTTTVEGVETPEQLAFTSAEGCDQVQGFLVSRPLPAAELARFIEQPRKVA